MREFFEVINEYPCTTFIVFCMICIILSAIKDVIHGANIYERCDSLLICQLDKSALKFLHI